PLLRSALMEQVATSAPSVQRRLHRWRRDRQIIEAQRGLVGLQLSWHGACGADVTLDVNADVRTKLPARKPPRASATVPQPSPSGAARPIPPPSVRGPLASSSRASPEEDSQDRTDRSSARRLLSSRRFHLH